MGTSSTSLFLGRNPRPSYIATRRTRIGYGKAPPPNSAIRLVAINSASETRWYEAFYDAYEGYVCDEMKGVTDWRRLGYVMADRSEPHGPLQDQGDHWVRLD